MNSILKLKSKFLVFLIPLLFFIVSVGTLSDYGISWDTPIHLRRGHAYFHLLTTGNKDYKDLQGERGYFQSDIQNASYFLEDDGGHPPINGILSAFTNIVFYQKLGLMGDIEAHHLFIVLSSALLVLLIGIFAYQEIGLIGAIFSQIALSTYPLFFAESHFNIKDPPQTLFYSLTIFIIWRAIKKRKPYLLFIAAMTSGLALGIKFNIVFLPFIIFPFLLFYFKKNFRSAKKYIISLLVIPAISLAILFLFWPYLWQDPLGNLLSVVSYYKEIGTESNVQSRFILPGGFNGYPLIWIIITTPPVLLPLALIGMVCVLKDKGKNKATVLWLLWMVIPILRVSVPGASIYGGVRQIMEFIPALALMVGFGISEIFARVKAYKKTVILAAILLSSLFLPTVYSLFKLHPNQNVYFNFLVGGIRGAVQRNIPYWGNSFGNAYFQAAQWLNNNAEQNARIALVQGTMTNIPTIQLRQDIDFSNLNWSGIFQKGEYMVELTHNDPVRLYPYGWDYIETFLTPVHEVSVDGVALAKIWKNDPDHVVEELRKNETRHELLPKNIDNTIYIDLGSEKRITRLYAEIPSIVDCSNNFSVVELSSDLVNWKSEPDTIPGNQVTNYEPIDSTETLFLAAKKARYVRIKAPKVNSCILRSNKIYLWTLE